MATRFFSPERIGGNISPMERQRNSTRKSSLQYAEGTQESSMATVHQKQANESYARPLGKAMTQTVQRTLRCAVILSIAAFAVTSQQLLQRQVKRAVIEQANLSAASIDLQGMDDVMPAIEQLLSRCPHVAGMATIGAGGVVEDIRPDRSEFRALVASVIAGGDAPVARSIDFEGSQRTVWAVRAKANVGDQTIVVCLFQPTSVVDDWMFAILTYGALIVTIGFIAARWARRWFERGIVTQLHRLATDTQHGIASLPISSDWRETRAIAERIVHLQAELLDAQRKIDRIRHDADSTIRSQELDFHRELRRIRAQAALDPLTELRNRSFVENELVRLFARFKKTGDHLAAVMIDVDNFKMHNDTLGHRAGDEVLRFLGQLLWGAIRPTDFAIRYGGDEFLLVLLHVDAEQARKICDRLIRLFAQYAKTLGGDKPLSLSAGIASLQEQDATDVHELVCLADQALYRAKRAGKNKVADLVTTTQTGR